MKLCAAVCAYGRPELLARVIACLQSQDYPEWFGLVYDDGGQLGTHWIGERICILSTKTREPSLGSKRNKSVGFAKATFRLSEDDAVLPIDSDDLFMPWHFSACAAALAKAEWSRPSVVLNPADLDNGVFVQNQTGRRDDPTKERMYHPAWAYRLSAFHRVGGYPVDQSGPEDRTLMLKLDAAGVTQADPIELGFRPSYCHVWVPGKSISSFLGPDDPKGKTAWERLAKTFPPAKLQPWVPSWDLNHPTILPGVRPRGF